MFCFFNRDFDKPNKNFYRNIRQLEKIVKKYKLYFKNKILKSHLIQLHVSNAQIDSWLVGTIIHSYSRTFAKIKKQTNYKIPSRTLTQMAYLKNKKQIVITDWKDECLKVIDLNGNFIGKFNANLQFFLPYAICISNKNEIFVAVQCICSIYVFNSNFEYIKEFNKKLLKTPFSMAIDDNLDHLYASDYYNNIVFIFDSDTGEFFNQLLIKKPKHIAVNEKHIFIISKNTINVITKTPPDYEIIQNIEFNNWYLPRSLYLDTQFNTYSDNLMKVFTMAYDVDNKDNVSQTLFLFLINQNNFNCIQKTNLNLTKLNDMIIIDRKVIVISENMENPLCIIDFE